MFSREEISQQHRALFSCLGEAMPVDLRYRGASLDLHAKKQRHPKAGGWKSLQALSEMMGTELMDST